MLRRSFKHVTFPFLSDIRDRRLALEEKGHELGNAAALAKTCGISKSYLYKIESSKATNVPYQMVKKIFSTLEEELKKEGILDLELPRHKEDTAGAIAEPIESLHQQANVGTAWIIMKQKYVGLIPVVDDNGALVDCLTYKRLLKLKDFNGKIEDALNKRLIDSRYSWSLRDVLSQEASIKEVREALLETQYGAVLVRMQGNKFGIITAQRLLSYEKEREGEKRSESRV
jgi:predicted transcriptional regulator